MDPPNTPILAPSQSVVLVLKQRIVGEGKYGHVRVKGEGNMVFAYIESAHSRLFAPAKVLIPTPKGIRLQQTLKGPSRNNLQAQAQVGSWLYSRG